MCAYKTDVDKFYGELNDHYQSVVVALDVEHVVLVPYAIHAVECCLYIGKTSPIAMFYN